MENVLSALVVIFVVLFGALTLSNAFMTAQDTLQAAWQEMETRLNQQTRTHLTVADAEVVSNGTLLNLMLENSGTTKLADFDRWDVMVQYADDGTPADYHIGWLPFAAGSPALDEWTVEGIYLDGAAAMPETLEENILNPGEMARLQLNLDAPVGIGEAMGVAVSVDNGATVTAFTTRNTPPVLATNSTLLMNMGETATITTNLLNVTDIDDAPADLVYTVTTPPINGTLSLGTTFTQEDIEEGLLEYTPTARGTSTFAFTVTDGVDVIGAYTFTIGVNQPPVLTRNTGLRLNGGQRLTINNTRLQSTDADNTAANLVYTVIEAPLHGTLSLPTTFTQQQIDNNLLTYTHNNVGNGLDFFRFTVSDGRAVIGDYIFSIYRRN